MSKSKYQRILLKLSGESLMGQESQGIDPLQLHNYTEQIIAARNAGIQIGLVVGGGNFFRGISGAGQGVDRVNGDYMGMLATVINGLALQSAFRKEGIPCNLYTSIRMEPVGELWNRHKVLDALNQNHICIFTSGTGNPYFTTDTTAALRALEIGADALLKGTRVDGVYSDDPEKNPDAKQFTEITFNEVIQRDLRVMDQTAFTLCHENDLRVIVFNMNQKGNLQRLISGDNIGTIITN